MAQGAISDEINRHVEALVVLSKRDMLRRLLREAELCVELEEVSAAAILAGIALEELALLSDPNILRQYERSFETWRELRNRAAHPAPREQQIEPTALAAMLTAIRAILDRIDGPQERQRRHSPPESELTKIRGKYAFTPTSVNDFLERKREDIELENRE